MSGSGASDSWELVVPDDEHELLAALRQHGVRPGQRLHLSVVPGSSGSRRRARGALAAQIRPGESLTWDDFEAVHEDNVESARSKYGEPE